MTDRPLWQPSAERIASTRLAQFIGDLRARGVADLRGYHDLHRFSIERMEAFWPAVWDFTDVEAETRGEVVLSDGGRMPGTRFFPEAKLNFARNLLRDPDETTAIVFWGEDRVRRSLTRAELHAAVGRASRALSEAGVGVGDRVAAYLPNMPEAIVGMLATAALGAIWSSCSPDFGVQGVVDRFGQIGPTVLLAADGYYYGGRAHESLTKLAAIQRQLPSLLKTLVVPYLADVPDLTSLTAAENWTSALARQSSDVVEFPSLPFNHPLYLLYSSGTTGVPKCILHGAGNTLVQHLKEHQFHCDIHPGDRVFYFTTCGWMMWNWLASVLASRATLLLYDGSPFHPDGNVLFDFADATGMTLFGTSAKFIAAVDKAGLAPRRTHRLDTLRTITSTGSPLAAESFDFVYERIKTDVHLASISGGTDIVSCFVGGDPTGPVWGGEIQVRGLGMDVDVYDEEGRPVRGEKGELVCRKPFPSMPLEFWNDHDGAKYHAAYFAKFPGIWCHGDYAEITQHDGIIIHGRSDAVLNPGGVRIGTAEIYRQVEQLPEVIESLAVGQQWDGDERVVLFVRLRDGIALDNALEDRIRVQIRRNTTPRHVPARIVAVTDIPRTKSGKIVELAVREVVHGRDVKNREALANPEALDQFRNRSELAQ